MDKVFDYLAFERMVLASRGAYLKADPFPYAYFDGLFDEDCLTEVNDEIGCAEFNTDVRAIDGVEVKTRSDFEDNEALPAATRRIFEVINGGKFLSMVSKLTGIEGLISDPYFDGGGINVIENGGTLAVHVDGTTQHRMQICRRINAILFLNDDWDPNWNGYHEQWEFMNKDLGPLDEGQTWKCVRKILPKRNRLYIFTTNDHSWHGHAGVLQVPEGVQRRSLIAYYYTSSRPGTDLVFDSPHRALFVDNSITLNDGAFVDAEVIL